MSPRPPAPTVADEAEVWRLRDRRDFLRRSLADAEREHAAGDLDDGDYSVLRRRDEAALATVERQLGALEPTPRSEQTGGGRPEAAGPRPSAPAPGRRRRRWWMVAVGVAALLAGTVVLVLSLTSPRLPGQTSSGGIQLDPAQQVTRDLAQAALEVRQGKAADALVLYRQVLAVDPNQPEALAEWGWLTWQSARAAGNTFVEGQAEASVTRAVAIQPDFAAAHLYLGTMRLEGDHDPAGAVAQYRLFLAQGPPAAQLQAAAPFLRQAFAAAGQPLPPQVPPA